MKLSEKTRKVDVKVSYLVLTEMLAHLNDPIDSDNYLECKNGLYAALRHSDYKVENVLPNTDNEFAKFITGKLPIADSYRQNSLYESLLFLDERGFSDALIRQNHNVIKTASDYLKDLKNSWKDSFVDQFLIRHDPHYGGNWQVFANDKEKRATLLRELRKAKKNNRIYRDFGMGMYLYISNNINGIVLPQLDETLLQKIIKRFKPLFSLQYRILEFMCQSGYNIEKYINDITDYLIVGNLEESKSIFVSNETANLIPNLHIQGFEKDVWTFNQYCSALAISYRK